MENAAKFPLIGFVVICHNMNNYKQFYPGNTASLEQNEVAKLLGKAETDHLLKLQISPTSTFNALQMRSSTSIRTESLFSSFL